jgi:Aromatic prenyltransferase Orf2
MTDVQCIRNDVVRSAQLSGVAYSEATIDRVFESFGDKFTHQIVDFKTTTKPLPKRGFYFRYMEENEECFAWNRACKSGLLPNQNRQVDRLVPEIYENFPLMADGIDFEVNYGLSKIWQFTKDVFPVEQAFKIDSMPNSLIYNANFFKKHHLNTLCIFGADYQHNSMNLYFQADSKSHKTSHFYRNILQDLNFTVPSDSTLELFTKTGGISVTLTWDSNKIERVCFYIPGFKRENISAYSDSSMMKFVSKCPSLVREPDFILGWSFGLKDRSGTYLKLEIDYSGNVLSLFGKALTPRIYSTTRLG